MSEEMERAGAALRNHMETRTTSTEQAALRARIVEAASGPRKTNSWRMVAMATTVVAIAIVLKLSLSQSSISFVVGPAQVPGRVGTYLTAEGKDPLYLRFSEGSEVSLTPGARARVQRTDDKGGVLVLENGKVACRILHKTGAKWSVEAGPYVVQVTGTTFEVSWDVVSSLLTVQMHEGTVLVRGPGIDPNVLVAGNERFLSRANLALTGREPASPAPALPIPLTSAEIQTVGQPGSDSRLGLEPSPSASSPKDGGIDSTLELSGSASIAPEAAASGKVSHDSMIIRDLPDTPPPESWNSLVARGEYRKVMTEAEARGIDSVLASGTDSEVGALADASRYLGRHDLAMRALLAMRNRFPKNARSIAATFLLGRMADDRGDTGGAMGWYDRYLAEAPAGPLAPEALGRRMVALRRSGNPAAAKQAAEAYLQRFPRGPYAGVAQEMLAN